MTIATELQKLHQDSPLIELYTVDATALGGSVYRYTPHFADGGTIAFNSLTYTSLPIISEGWEVTATGTQPRPTLSITNVNQVLLNSVITLGDLVGAKVTRVRTYKKFLDGESAANPNAYLRPEVYVIEQKLTHTLELITWQLSSIIDKFGSKLPARQMTRTNFPGMSRARGAW